MRIPFHFAPPAAPHEAPPTPPSPTRPPVKPTPKPPTPAPKPAAPARAAEHKEPTVVSIIGRTRPPSRGASVFVYDIGEFNRIPRKNASDLLTLAPGVLLTNEGGDGHAEQVFLRGFDAREGQDLEFSVGGMPINSP